MKRLSILALLLLAAGCSETHHFIDPPPIIVHGNGDVIDQSRSVSGFSRINHQGIGKLYIEQGAHEQLRIRAESNLMNYLMTEVQGGELTIWKDRPTLLNTAPIEYRLTVVDLERLALNGAGGILGSDLDVGTLTLRARGVGTIELANLNATRIDFVSSGVGNHILSGSVQEQRIELRGLGSHDGRDLASVTAEVLIGSGGSATVRVEENLDATINGIGNIYYIGSPVVDSSISGSGDVIQIGE